MAIQRILPPSQRGGPTAPDVRQGALSKWLNQQRRATEQFTAAQQPLQQAVQMFQPGGGYGRGQETLLRDEARRSLGEATTKQVASGMSSGSLATGTGLRVERDLATNLAGVEDVRTQFLTQALQMLSGLRGTQAQTTAQVTDPTYNAFMNYLTSIGGGGGVSGGSGLPTNYNPLTDPMRHTPRPTQTKQRSQGQSTFNIPRQ